ncbi:MAG TPA: DUF5666 domain-containing protein [Acidimicrobiales bacterium]|nr:DUF5666 domain-containing protein [Acidimicrobiales bacterium]
MSRSVTSLAMGMALTVGGASLASASGGRNDGSKNHDCASGKVSAFDYARGGSGGYVTAVTATSVTIQKWDGTTSTFTLTPTTTYTEEESASTLASLVVGDRADITASPSAPTIATSVNIELAQLFGTVTAVNGNSITISDPQGFSRTIVVSSATTYSNDGAAGTLADVVVGSKIAAQGTIDANLTSLDALSVAVGTAGHKESTSGVVTAVTSSSVTVQGKDGSLTTYTFTPTTTFSEGSVSLSASSLAVGNRVDVKVDSSAPTTALKVEIRPSFEAGVVTAISGNTITIKDFQGTTDSIVVSSATTYDQGHATGTLADVIVGAKIFASGNIASDGSTLDALRVIIAPVDTPTPIIGGLLPNRDGKKSRNHASHGDHGSHRGDHGSFSGDLGLSFGVQKSFEQGDNQD